MLVEGLERHEQSGEKDAAYVSADNANGQIAHGEVRLHAHYIEDEKAARNADRNELTCARLGPIFLLFEAV